MESLQQCTQIAADLLSLRDFHSFFLDLFGSHIVQCFHAEADLAVIDADDLHFYGVPLIQNGAGIFDMLVRNLRNVHQAGETVA